MTGAQARPRLSYVTDLELTPSGGGAYAVNWHAFDQLRERFDAFYSGPIVPRPPFAESMISKVRRRILHRPGRYTYFSPATLDRNADLAMAQIPPDSKAVVFRSAGRWCRCRPSVPYFVYLDAVVHTFFYNTFDERHFDSDDLARIWREEREFLKGAAGVFFESEWGLRMAREAYGLNGNRYEVAGRGGAIAPPASDTWNGESLALLTIAMDFKQKGGDLVAAAYSLLKPRFPSLTWHIVGGRPDFDPASVDGVTYEGVLRPGHAADRNVLSSILSSAFLCVHPTREDVTPLVLTEAAYFGCPSISMKAFSIPELVLDGRTGILLEPPPEPAALAAAIESLLADRERYLRMRREARDYALSSFSWERTGDIISDRIMQAIA